MDNISKEMKLLELNISKLKVELNSQHASLDHNISIIKESLRGKENKLKKNNYSRSYTCCKFQDKEIVPFMQAVANSITIINERLLKLEKHE